MTAAPARSRIRSPNRRRLLAWCLGAGAAPLAAQTPVYESRDKDGPVFSDRPSPGATPVKPSPINVVPAPPPAAASAPGPSAAASPTPPYRSLRIGTPANQGTVHSNTGAFDVVVQASPALRTNAGDRIRLMLDGTVLPQAQTSTRIRLSEADWQAAAATGTGQHTLQAAIVDTAGDVLITSVPIVFYVQRAAIGGRRR